MPISGGPPGLTFNFEREDETIPGTSSLVIGDAKIVSAGSSTGSACNWESQHQPGNWDTAESGEGTALEVSVNRRQVPGFIAIEAGQWRIENPNAADRVVRLSVINVG